MASTTVWAMDRMYILLSSGDNGLFLYLVIARNPLMKMTNIAKLRIPSMRRRKHTTGPY